MKIMKWIGAIALAVIAAIVTVYGIMSIANNETKNTVAENAWKESANEYSDVTILPTVAPRSTRIPAPTSTPQNGGANTQTRTGNTTEQTDTPVPTTPADATQPTTPPTQIDHTDDGEGETMADPDAFAKEFAELFNTQESATTPEPEPKPTAQTFVTQQGSSLNEFELPVDSPLQALFTIYLNRIDLASQLSDTKATLTERYGNTLSDGIMNFINSNTDTNSSYEKTEMFAGENGQTVEVKRSLDLAITIRVYKP